MFHRVILIFLLLVVAIFQSIKNHESVRVFEHFRITCLLLENVLCYLLKVE